MRKTIKQEKYIRVQCRFLVDTVVISQLIFVNVSLSVQIITDNYTMTGS
jgi:hypothetical protein